MLRTIDHQCGRSLTAKEDEKANQTSFTHGRQPEQIKKGMLLLPLVLNEALEKVELFQNGIRTLLPGVFRAVTHGLE